MITPAYRDRLEAYPTASARMGQPDGPAPIWQTIAAMLWVLLFGVFFFHFELPNGEGTHRLTVMAEAPELLLNAVAPLPPPPNPPNPHATLLWEHSGWTYLPQRFWLILIAASILAGAWGLGHLILRAVRLPLPSRCMERTVFAFALGLAGLSLATLGFGLVGLLSRAILCGFIALCAMAELWWRFRELEVARPGARWATIRTQLPHLWRDQRHGIGVNNRGIPGLGFGGLGWLACAVPFLLCMLLGALLPEVDFDVKEYHFEGPKEWNQSGRIEFLPHNVYTSFPFLTEMLTLLGMVLHQDWYWGALAGKGVLMCFAPLTALGLWAAGNRWFGPAAGAWAALIHLSTPWIYRISIIAYAEGGLTFYLFATLFAAGLAIERLARSGESQGLMQAGSALDLDSKLEAQAKEDVDRSFAGASGFNDGVNNTGGDQGVPRLFFLAGLLAGCSMACKYPGVVSVVVPFVAVCAAAPFVLRIPRPERFSVAARSVGLFVLGAALTVGPWLAKNAWQTGNPVYPLLYSVFGGRDWDAALDAKWKRAHSPDRHELSDLGVKLIDVTAKSDWLSPLLFGLAPLAWFRRGARSRVHWLWGYVAYLFLTWWGLTHRIDRFWVPLIPVVALLAGAGATWNRSRLWRCFLLSCAGFCGLFNLAFMTSSLCGYNQYLLDLNLARTETGNLTAPEIMFLNEQLPPNSKVLCVGEAEVFDARFPLLYNTVFDRSILETWCAVPAPGRPAGQLSMRSADEIRQVFQDAGVTHVLVNWQEILRYRTTYGYTDFVAPERFKQLQDLGILGPAWRIPAHQPFESLGPAEQREIIAWGRLLIENHAGRKMVRTFEVFPVFRKAAR